MTFGGLALQPEVQSKLIMPSIRAYDRKLWIPQFQDSCFSAAPLAPAPIAALRCEVLAMSASDISSDLVLPRRQDSPAGSEMASEFYSKQGYFKQHRANGTGTRIHFIISLIVLSG